MLCVVVKASGLVDGRDCGDGLALAVNTTDWSVRSASGQRWRRVVL